MTTLMAASEKEGIKCDSVFDEKLSVLIIFIAHIITTQKHSNKSDNMITIER